MNMNMKNNTTEDYVNSENAELLKEKGFNVVSTKLINKESIVEDVINKNEDYEFWFSQPTIYIACKWIRVNFNHDIEVRGCRYAGDDKSSYYQPYVNGVIINMKRFNTVEDAYQEGIKHCLSELI